MSSHPFSKGSILLVSLWATAALAAIGILQATQLSLELKWAGRLQEERQAWYLARTGVEVAGARISTDDPAWDSLRDSWGQAPKDPVAFGPGTFRYSVTDENARIPLNALGELDKALAPQGLNLLGQLGFPPSAAQQLLDRLNQVPAKPIRHLGELLALSGMTPELLSQMVSWVTVYGNGPVNINTASVEVLTRLGLSSGLANQMVTLYRSGPGPDGIAGTSDDGIFTDAGQIGPVLSANFGPLASADQALLAALVGHNPPLLGVSSAFFRVESEGRAGRHGIQKKIAAVLERKSPGALPLLRGWNET
ncbi:MAG: general secretion pathway protein GspK [Candidatus Omnitrophica bacterium]|nr:general secretion pathway protein GspK [Candidatus Omnitrophota bacterium]